MNTTSARQVASLTGSSVPRVLRLAHTLGFDEDLGSSARRKRRFTPQQVRALVTRLGRPSPPRIAGLSQAESRVLAALRTAPLGLTSARAVARVAHLSPTTAVGALTRLTDRGLVHRKQRMVAEADARAREVLTVNVGHPEWAGFARDLHAFHSASRLPAPGKSPRQGVPARLAHVFWNEDLRELDPDRHGSLIAKRILQAKDPQALAWAAGRLDSQDWNRAAQTRAIDPRDAALARSLARTAAERSGLTE